MCLTVQDEIDGVITELDQALSYGPSEAPRWERLRALFHPTALWIHNKYGAPQIRTLDQFIAAQAGARAGGQRPSHYQKEIAQRSEIFGTVAHRMSTYETRADRSQPTAESRAVRSVQFLKSPGQWLIVSLIWCEEKDGYPIPAAYLPPT